MFPTFLYDPNLIQPMREELTALGFRELTTAEEVEEVLGRTAGTVLVVVNSVCGCAAGSARPGVALALRNPVLPETMVTVFAGQDREATAQARRFFQGLPASSPMVVLLQDGEVVWALQRQDIEGREAPDIAARLTEAFDRYCPVPV